MKKFFCLFFVVGHFNLFAQDCELPVFGSEINTGNNSTILMLDAFIASLAYNSSSPYIVAKTEAGLVVGSSCIADHCLDSLGQQSIAIWGDDSMSPEIDGALGGETISLKLVDDYLVFHLNTPSITYNTNEMDVLASTVVQSFECTGYVSGCSNPTACNYDAFSTEDDGSCAYPQQYYDCNGQCLSDTDGDGICDELEIVGCTEPMACNYEPTATDEGSCEYFGIDSCNVSVMEVNRSDFKLYPNPGNDRINIQSTYKHERLEISMTNILGAKLFYRSLNDVHPSDLIEVYLPALPSGVYTVTFSSSSEKSSVRWIKK